MASVKLGTRLLRDGVIGLSELEAALRAQVLYGGRLGTNLVELGFIDIDTLGQYVALTTGAPEATRDRFEAASEEVIEGFDLELAARYHAFPLGFEADAPETLCIAVLDPTDEEQRAALEARLGHPVRLYAAAEMRLFFYLEKYYGVERPIRYVRTSSPPREQGKVERRRVQGAPRGVKIEPRRARAARASGSGAVPLEALVERVETAAHRDRIIEALLELAAGRLDVLVALLVRDGKAMGWRQYSAHAGADADADAVSQISLSLDATSSLKLAYDAGETYWGPVPEAGSPVEEALWAVTATPQPPEEVLVAPVVVGERIVHLLYAHRAGGVGREARDGLVTMAAAAGRAYQRLIRALKEG